MLAIKINDIKTFMNQLLIGDTFDAFPMAEASIAALTTFSIDGRINKDFFDTDTQDILTRNGAIYSRWKDIKPFVRSIIRGKLLPLHLKVVFCLSESQLSVLTDSSIILSTDSTGIQGYFLNIQYRNHTLLCTTGIARETFTMDKKPEQFWDELVLSFFRHLDIDFDNL